MSGMTIPTIPSLPAGYIVTLADAQNLAAAATFLLNKPFSFILDETGGMAIGTAVSSVSFTNAIVDPDAMWAVANPARIVVQTPGWYKVRYGVNCGTGGGVYNTFVNVITGANNPAGAGMTVASVWGGYSSTVAAGQAGWAGGGGILPVYMYQGDRIEVRVKAAAAGTSTGVTPPAGATLGGSWASLELVSI